MQKKINYFPERAERLDRIKGGRSWYVSGLFPRTVRGAMRACAKFRIEEHGARRSVFLASQGLFFDFERYKADGNRWCQDGGVILSVQGIVYHYLSSLQSKT